jgi:hypothetical protein
MENCPPYDTDLGPWTILAQSRLLKQCAGILFRIRVFLAVAQYESLHLQRVTSFQAQQCFR